jgi:arginine:pyruvate transaminase
MSEPRTLSRPLAARTANLPAPREFSAGPATPSPVAAAAIDALEAGKTHYTDRPGILPLRQWVTRYLQERFGVSYDADAVTITCGATEARFVALKLLAADAFIVCPSASDAIAGPAHLAGATVAALPEDPARARLLYLTPADTRDAVEPLLTLAAQHEWWIIFDVSRAPETGAFHPAQRADLAPHTVTLGSFSGHLPGWRVGWMAGSTQAGKLRAFKQSMTICSTSISQWAALGLVDTP